MPCFQTFSFVNLCHVFVNIEFYNTSERSNCSELNNRIFFRVERRMKSSSMISQSMDLGLLSP